MSLRQERSPKPEIFSLPELPPLSLATAFCHYTGVLGAVVLVPNAGREGLEEASILLVSPFIPLQDGDNSGYFTLGLL